ncbi:MAG: hypothetical protein HGA67_03560 [Candidatus Yonathbacteria bacterium]|nr:hypothetical protein [Candidatus Yonathbacteria bacterium]
MEYIFENHSSEDIQEQKTSDEILNDFDEYILEEGVPGVIEKMLEKFNSNLPKVVIYPETSARPLYYVFDPVFEKISKIKHVDKPKIIFFNVHQPDTLTIYYEDEGNLDDAHFDKLKKNIIDDKEFREAERNEHPWPTEPLSDEVFAEEIKKDMERIQHTQDNRVHEKERVDEILGYLQKNDMTIDDVAVIDEFIMEGDTSYEINKIFGHEIPYFAVFAVDFSVGSNQAGYVSHADGPGSGMLSYKADSFFRKSIGVKKGEGGKYSTPNNKRDGFTREDVEMMATLRKEMRMIGEKIAETLKVN